jgi:hypothetical protein
VQNCLGEQFRIVGGLIDWMWLAREPGAGSGERGAGIKRAGSRDCHNKSRNR